MGNRIMATWTYEISTEHNIYPNITVYDRFRDGSPYGWRVEANEGYVMYHANANDTEPDPVTGEIRPVTYYYTASHLSPYYNWNNFDFVAVLRSTVDENYIFGGGDADKPEIM